MRCPEMLDKWHQVLAHDYHVVTAFDFNEFNTNYPLTLLDADFIDQGKMQIYEIKNYPSKLLIIGNHWSDEQQIKVIVSGAAGYCEYETDNRIILSAVESILEGDIWVQRHLVSRVIGSLLKITTPPTPPPIPKKFAPAGFEELSARERDVARLILQGVNNKVIASELFISERTVKAHLTSIFKKLNVPDRLHLAILLKESDALFNKH